MYVHFVWLQNTNTATTLLETKIIKTITVNTMDECKSSHKCF